MSHRRNQSLPIRLGVAAGVLCGAVVADAQQLLRDDFDQSGIVDTRVWRLPFDSEGTFVGRTQYRGDAAVDVPLQGVAEAGAGDGLVTEVHLDTFSTIDPGDQFLGTDLLTKRDFARGGGVTFEGRLRLKPAAGIGGVVGGFFTFDVSREDPQNPGESVRDEIDFELLGNQIAGGTQDIFTNVYDEVGFVPPNILGDLQSTDIAGFDLTQFQTYRIEWTPNHVKWFVNDQLIRTDRDNVPDDPQKLHFNIWAPDSGFSEAFSGALQPTAVEGNNQRFTAQLDYVEVNRINTNTSENLLVDGSFEMGEFLSNVPIGTNTGSWYGFNEASIAFANFAGSPPAETPEDGGQLGLTSGPFKDRSDASGIWQQVPASPGEEFEITAKAFTTVADSIAGTDNFVTVGIQFADAAGNTLETSPFVPLDGSDFPLIDGRGPNVNEGEWLDGVANAKAPEGTAFARAVLLFVQVIDPPFSGGDPGAVFWDSVSLVKLTPQGDFNGDGQIDAADYTVWRDNLGAADDAALNGAGDGQNGVDIGDYLLWKSVVTGIPIPPPTVASPAPEPATAGVLLASLPLLLRRHR